MGRGTAARGVPQIHVPSSSLVAALAVAVAPGDATAATGQLDTTTTVAPVDGGTDHHPGAGAGDRAEPPVAVAPSTPPRRSPRHRPDGAAPAGRRRRRRRPPDRPGVGRPRPRQPAPHRRQQHGRAPRRPPSPHRPRLQRGGGVRPGHGPVPGGGPGHVERRLPRPPLQPHAPLPPGQRHLGRLRHARAGPGGGRGRAHRRDRGRHLRLRHHFRRHLLLHDPPGRVRPRPPHRRHRRPGPGGGLHRHVRQRRRGPGPRPLRDPPRRRGGGEPQAHPRPVGGRSPGCGRRRWAGAPPSPPTPGSCWPRASCAATTSRPWPPPSGRRWVRCCGRRR